MKTSRLLMPLLFLCALLLFIPAHANAGTIETVETILDIVHESPTGDDVPSGSEIDPLIRCLADKGQNIGACAEFAGSDNPYINTIVDLYQAVSSDNFGDIVAVVVTWLGDNAPCIIADIMTGGVGGSLCDLVKAVLETLENIGEAILDFFADIGGAVIDAVEDVGCAIGLGGCDESSPPDQIAYAWVYAPKIADGVAAIEDVDSSKFKQVTDQLRAQASADPAQLNIQLPWGFSMTFPGWAVNNAEGVYKKVVTKYWDADMLKSPGGIYWALETKRGEYFNDQNVIYSIANEAVMQQDPAKYIWDRCTQDFREVFAFAQVDRWIYSGSEDQDLRNFKNNKAETNSKWCSNTFHYKHNPNEFLAIFRDYVKATFCDRPGDQFVCPTITNLDSCSRIMGAVPANPRECTLREPSCGSFLNMFYCSTVETYKFCRRWAESVGESPDQRCGIETAQLAPEAAYRVRKALIDAGSQFASACTIDGKKAGALTFAPPTELKAYSQALGGNQPVSSQAGKLQGKSTSKTINNNVVVQPVVMKKPPKTSPSVLDCPRPMLKYWCGKKYAELYSGENLPIELVNCTATEDSNYSKIHQQVNAAVEKINQKNAKQFMQHSHDPLLVLAPNYGAYSEEEKAKTKYFKSPTPKSTFDFNSTADLKQPIDGFASPLLYYNLQGQIAKQLEDESHTGVPIEKKLSDSIGKMKTGGDPINQSQGTVGIQQGQVTPAVQNQNMIGRTGMAVNTPNQTVYSGKVQGLDPERLSGQRDNYTRMSEGWRNLAPLDAAPRGCSCASLLTKIKVLDAQSAKLIEEGDALSEKIGSGQMKKGDVRRAMERQEEIAKQLDANMTERRSLVDRYNIELRKSSLRVLTPGR